MDGSGTTMTSSSIPTLTMTATIWPITSEPEPTFTCCFWEVKECARLHSETQDFLFRPPHLGAVFSGVEKPKAKSQNRLFVYKISVFICLSERRPTDEGGRT